MIERLRVLMLSWHVFKFDLLNTEFQLLNNLSVALPGLETVTSFVCVDGNSFFVEAIGDLPLQLFFGLFIFVHRAWGNCTSSCDATTAFKVGSETGQHEGRWTRHTICVINLVIRVLVEWVCEESTFVHLMKFRSSLTTQRSQSYILFRGLWSSGLRNCFGRGIRSGLLRIGFRVLLVFLKLGLELKNLLFEDLLFRT